MGKGSRVQNQGEGISSVFECLAQRAGVGQRTTARLELGQADATNRSERAIEGPDNFAQGYFLSISSKAEAPAGAFATAYKPEHAQARHDLLKVFEGDILSLRHIGKLHRNTGLAKCQFKQGTRRIAGAAG